MVSATDALMNYGEMLGSIAALVGGYKTQLVSAGLTAEAAEEMAVTFHATLIDKLMHPEPLTTRIEEPADG